MCGIFAYLFVLSREVSAWMPPFFWKDNTLRRSPGKIYFSPGVPPWPHMTPCRRVNLGNIRYFEARGLFEEKLERQGKGNQNVWNEPNDAPLSPWVFNMACWAEIPFSNLKNFENHPYFKSFLQGEFFQQKRRKIRVIFEIFEFWKRNFCSTSHVEDPRA